MGWVSIKGGAQEKIDKQAKPDQKEASRVAIRGGERENWSKTKNNGMAVGRSGSLRVGRKFRNRGGEGGEWAI